MSVILETSKGDLIVDLFVDDCPTTCKSFLKLCKIKYFHNSLFFNVQPNFIAQTGDPTGTGRGGSSIYGVLYGDQARFYEDEIKPHLRHKRKGMLGMVSKGENQNASQFYITLAPDLDSLDEKHTVFGEVAEGLDVLDKFNEAFVDPDGRPYQNIRIRHTIVMDDPFEDPPQLAEHIPDASPTPQFEQGDRLEDDWVPIVDSRSAEEIEEEQRHEEAKGRAVVLEMIGDLPEADVKPPSDMLFVCKLNQVTTEEDLETIFARFGNVVSCDIIRDFKTGDSLCYAFIGFDNEESAEEAYFKMNNVLIDDRRIKVDFSQSVYHIWKQFRRFGKKGDKLMMQEADQHQGRSDRLQVKQARHLPQGGADLLFEHDEPAAEQQQHKRQRTQAPPGPPASGGRGGPGGRHGGRGEDRPCREQPGPRETPASGHHRDGPREEPRRRDGGRSNGDTAPLDRREDPRGEPRRRDEGRAWEEPGRRERWEHPEEGPRRRDGDGRYPGRQPEGDGREDVRYPGERRYQEYREEGGRYTPRDSGRQPPAEGHYPREDDRRGYREDRGGEGRGEGRPAREGRGVGREEGRPAREGRGEGREEGRAAREGRGEGRGEGRPAREGRGEGREEGRPAREGRGEGREEGRPARGEERDGRRDGGRAEYSRQEGRPEEDARGDRGRSHKHSSSQQREDEYDGDRDRRRR